MPQTKKRLRAEEPLALGPYVPAVGPLGARIAFVAEAPGADEEKALVPLVGYSGQFFREKLMQVGLTFDECFVTNVCHYRPPHNKIEKWIKSFGHTNICNRPVLGGIIELYCTLAKLVENGGAHVIVPMGNVALWALTGKMNVTKRRASLMSIVPQLNIFVQIKEMFPDLLKPAMDAMAKIQGRKVIPTIHPAGITRQLSLSIVFLHDLQRIVSESVHPNIILPERIHYTDPTQEQAVELVRKLLEFDCISLDIESVGHRLFCVGFCGDPRWSLVLRADASWKMQLIRHICEHPVKKIMQFGWYDTWFLQTQANVQVRNYLHDLAIAARCAYPELPVGLDFQTSIQTREPYYKDEGKNWDSRDAQDIDTFLTYNGKDVCVTKEIHDVQLQDELSDPSIRVAFEHKMKLVPIAVEMATQGIRIDKEKLDALKADYDRQAIELQNVIDSLILKQLKETSERNPPLAPACLKLAQRMLANVKKNKPAFMVDSTGEGNMMDTYIYEIRGFTPIKHRDTKKRTTDEEALKELYGDTGDGILLTLVQKRKIDKLRSTELAIRLDGTDHTYFSINPCHTKSGRWSFTENSLGYGCNAQAWHPRAKCLVLPEEGHVWLICDLAQVEDRIVAYLADVEKKKWAFENGVDAHALTATAIFACSLTAVLEEEAACRKEGKQSPRRYLGKQSNHAYNYGEGPVRFWKRVNKRRDETGVSISRKQAYQAKDAHGRLYPEIGGYQREIDRRVYTDRYLTNCFGWRRYFRGILTDELKRDAYSWIPQSTAPWIVDLGILAVRDSLKKDIAVSLHAHDAAYFQIPRDGCEQMAREIQKLMTFPIPVGRHEITIPVDFKIQETW